MAEEEEKKAEEQPADAKKEGGPKKSEPKPAVEKEEVKAPAPPRKAPTVEDIEDVLKEVMGGEPSEQEVKVPDAEVPPTAEVESEVPPLKTDLAQPKERIVVGDGPNDTSEDGPAEEIKGEPQVLRKDKVEEVPRAEEPEAEELEPKDEPELTAEVQKVKEEASGPPKEKKEEAAVEKADKPPKEKKVKEEKPKKAQKPDKEVASEDKSEPEKPAARKPRKPPAEGETMIISPLIFGRFDLREVEVTDPGLRKYINLSPVGIPHTGARHANRWLGKTKINIVERLINNMMRTEHSTGKKSFAYKAVNSAFVIISKKTKNNPIQVLVDALQNASPKEEITRLRFGGISVPKAVDTSSSRRLDIALRNICKGAVSSSHRSKKHVELCLADEIILASKGDMNSYAISKKEETERIASSAR